MESGKEQTHSYKTFIQLLLTISSSPFSTALCHLCWTLLFSLPTKREPCIAKYLCMLSICVVFYSLLARASVGFSRVWHSTLSWTESWMIGNICIRNVILKKCFLWNCSLLTSCICSNVLNKWGYNKKVMAFRNHKSSKSSVCETNRVAQTESYCLDNSEFDRKIICVYGENLPLHLSPVSGSLMIGVLESINIHCIKHVSNQMN